MKKYFFIIFLGFSNPLVLSAVRERSVSKDSSVITVDRPTEYARMPLTVGVIGKHDPTFVQTLHKDLSFSGQFDVNIKKFDAVPTKQQIQAYADKGCPLLIFCNQIKNGGVIEYRVYETSQPKMMLGKKYRKRSSAPAHWAHQISTVLWPQLTGHESCFSSKIAFCKEVIDEQGKRLQHIYMTDCTGGGARPLVTTRTINVAPRWHPNERQPILFYSEFTDKNMRLMAIDAHGHQRVIADFDGINMLPTFSKNGRKVVYAASHAGGRCNLFYREQRGRSQQITAQGNNVSPLLSADGTAVFFCSDYQTGYPQIYRYDIASRMLEQMTEGYCTAPSLSDVVGKLAYCRRVEGTMQIFMCDLATGEHEQLTSSYGNKGESSWSPCGNYVAFSIERGGKSRIAVMHVPTRKSRFITSARESCTYPAWSPRF